MRRPIKTRKDLDISSNHFLRRNPGYPFGVTLTELDYLRGWQDDFVGKVVDPRYTTPLVAGGTLALQDGQHGGVVRLAVVNAAGSSAKLILGDGAGGFSTACISSEWFIVLRMKISALNVAAAVFGAAEAGTNNTYYGGHHPAVSPNWVLVSVDNAGGSSSSVSAVPVDTNWHVLVFRSRVTFLELWLDGSLIVTHNTNLPSGCMEPFIQNARTAGAMNLDIDWIKVVWR